MHILCTLATFIHSLSKHASHKNISNGAIVFSSGALHIFACRVIFVMRQLEVQLALRLEVGFFAGVAYDVLDPTHLKIEGVHRPEFGKLPAGTVVGSDVMGGTIGTARWQGFKTLQRFYGSHTMTSRTYELCNFFKKDRKLH